MGIVFQSEHLAQLVFFIRGEKVMLDADLAMLYRVEARSLNQAVARNRKRFPADFMFRLTDDEYENIRSQFVAASGRQKRDSSQTVMSSRKHRGRSYRPYAFNEQGVAMLSSVLRSECAVEVNIAIMRPLFNCAGSWIATPISPARSRTWKGNTTSNSPSFLQR